MADQHHVRAQLLHGVERHAAQPRPEDPHLERSFGLREGCAEHARLGRHGARHLLEGVLRAHGHAHRNPNLLERPHAFALAG